MSLPFGSGNNIARKEAFFYERFKGKHAATQQNPKNRGCARNVNHYLPFWPQICSVRYHREGRFGRAAEPLRKG